MDDQSLMETETAGSPTAASPTAQPSAEAASVEGSSAGEPPTGEVSTAAPHPEEMKASVGLQIGKFVSVNATARTTPAGLAMAALLAATTLIPLLWFATRRRA